MPEKYRAPVILCHLEGLTHSEAARKLGWPEGTLSVRLMRARELLRHRLVRRGVAPAAALPAALWADSATAAAMPAGLVEATARSVMHTVVGRGPAASAAVGRLAEGVLRSLGCERFRGAAALLLAGAAIGAAATLQLASVDHRNARRVALVNRSGFSATRPLLLRDQAPARKTTDGLEPAPGYFWVHRGPVPFEWPPRRLDGGIRKDARWREVFRNPDRPDDPKHADVICSVVEVEDGSLLVTLLHPAGPEGEPVMDYRPVVFDARGRRYLPRGDHGAPRSKHFGARMPIDHYRLSPDILAAASVVSLGIERMTPTTLQLAQLDAALDQTPQPARRPAAADGGEFEATPESSWTIAPFSIARRGTTRFLGPEICCDVVKTRDGSLVIYLAGRRDAGCLPGDHFLPALFDARRRRLRPGERSSEEVSSLGDGPTSTRFATCVHWIGGTMDEKCTSRIERPAAEIAFVGLERTDPAVMRRLPRGEAPSTYDPKVPPSGATDPLHGRRLPPRSCEPA